MPAIPWVFLTRLTAVGLTAPRLDEQIGDDDGGGVEDARRLGLAVQRRVSRNGR